MQEAVSKKAGQAKDKSGKERDNSRERERGVYASRLGNPTRSFRGKNKELEERQRHSFGLGDAAHRHRGGGSSCVAVGWIDVEPRSGLAWAGFDDSSASPRASLRFIMRLYRANKVWIERRWMVCCVMRYSSVQSW